MATKSLGDIIDEMRSSGMSEEEIGDRFAEWTRDACDRFNRSPAGIAKADQLGALARDVAAELNGDSPSAS